MAILGFEIEELARLLALMESTDLEEIEWERASRYLKVSGVRAAGGDSVPPTHAPAALPRPPARRATDARPADQKAIASIATSAIAADEVALVSPMVGVYYRSGKPGDPPLVEVGQAIERDQPIGIIEAMKIFSEIPAEQGGIVVAVPAQDGQLVHAGTPLVIVKRAE